MSTNDALTVGLGRGGARAAWLLFLAFSGAFFWVKELVRLFDWPFEFAVPPLLVTAALAALLMHWSYRARSRQLESQTLEPS